MAVGSQSTEDNCQILPAPSAPPALPVHLQVLTNRARGYVEAASSINTRKAYASDWKHFVAWCRRSNLSPLPPHPRRSVSTSPPAPQAVPLARLRAASRRIRSPQSSAVCPRSPGATHSAGSRLIARTGIIATVMAGTRNTHARPPVQKEAVLGEDIIAMLETLDRGTPRGLRDRAMLLIGYAGGLRRSEIVGLDLKADQTEDGRGWIEILDQGLLVTLRGKTGWREVEVDERYVQKQLGHASAEMTRRYQRRRDRFRINLTKAAGL